MTRLKAEGWKGWQLISALIFKLETPKLYLPANHPPQPKNDNKQVEVYCYSTVKGENLIVLMYRMLAGLAFRRSDLKMTPIVTNAFFLFAVRVVHNRDAWI